MDVRPGFGSFSMRHSLFTETICTEQLRIARHLRYFDRFIRRKKKGYTYSRLPYYSNHVSTFNIEFICCHGDIHPHPGPQTGHRNLRVSSKGNNMAYVNPRSDVSVFYANSRSLVNKINQLELEIATYQYDLMVFTETHLDSSILDSELFPSIYTVFRRDRVQNGRRGGGILIAVRDTLRASVREDVNFDSELLFVDILFPANRKISLGVFYRPPNSSINCLLDLQTALDTVLSSSQNPEMVLVGDFNIPEFDWNTD